MSKILIVDDNANLSGLLKSFLEEKNYNVIVSHSGMDALEKVKNLKPDILLLDMIMDGMGGIEVLKRVRMFDKNIAIIMVTALLGKATCEEALKNGADRYITKPVDYFHLNKCILFETRN